MEWASPMRRLNKIALALTLLGMTSVASAQVYEMSFVDTLGAIKVRNPPPPGTTRHHNWW